MPSGPVLSVAVAAALVVGSPAAASACGGGTGPCADGPVASLELGVPSTVPLAAQVEAAWTALRTHGTTARLRERVADARRLPTTPSVPSRPTHPGVTFPV